MRVAVLTLGCWLMTRETVWCETPASAATSIIAGPRADGLGEAGRRPADGCLRGTEFLGTETAHEHGDQYVSRRQLRACCTWTLQGLNL